MADIFRIQVISNTDVRAPFITLGSTSFFHVRHDNLYIVAVTKNNANAALVFEFCYRFISLGKSYFIKFDEESVKNNFVLIYELLDGKALVFRPADPRRDIGFWLPPEHRRRHPQALHHDRRRQVRQGNGKTRPNATADTRVEGGLVQNHHPGDRRHLLAEAGHQIPQERGVC